MRKKFILKFDDLSKAKQVIINTIKMPFFKEYKTKREKIGNNNYIYWILLEINQKITLSNNEVFNSIYNLASNSITKYENFIEQKGEDFNLNIE